MQAIFLGDRATTDPGRVGAKAATLSQLAARYRVPAGFCLDASAHEQLRSALAGDAVAAAALRALVAAGYDELCRRTGRPDTATAVRSSALGEDGSETSFAGQHDTVLDVHGPDAIVEAVLTCWRSASSDRAVAYRAEHGVAGPALVAVLIQEMIPADAAAIAFSVDPVAGDRGIVVIDACLGLGEAIAAGTVTPDTFSVRKDGLAIVKRTISGERPALGDAQVREVVALAIALETERGGPVDVECAFAGPTLYLLQTRPITTLRGPVPFDVEWADPADAALTWSREDVHMNDCLPRLSCDYVINAPAFGLDKANDVFGVPVRVLYRAIHGYLYAASRPLVPASDLPAVQATGLTKRREAARTLARDWDERYLPTVLAHFAWMRAARIDDRASAARAWDELWPRINEIWLIHMLVVPPTYALLEELALLYASLTGRPATDAPALVQGRADTLQEMQQALHDIASGIRSAPAVAGAIAGLQRLDELGALDGGRPIRAAIERFLERHGNCGQAGFDIDSPSWADHPRSLFIELARLARSGGENPASRRARLLAESAALEARTREELRDRPDDLARFEEVLAPSQACGMLTEEHNYWIDRQCQAHVRRFVLQVGGVLKRAGLIAAAHDVYHLDIAEVRETLRTGSDRRPLIAARRAAFERDRRLRPPRFLGALPATPLPSSSIRDLAYRVEQTGGNVLSGVAASPGTGRGPARLVTGPGDFERFRSGDVLVCHSTTVSWVPLFTMASAIVADVGGALSHAALVAREFGIPAVCGTGTALELLIDGELVEVDGSAGTVRRIATQV